MVVAIDGPAGAGKSTVARDVAGTLGFTYLDSGAMYRAVALAALERGQPPAVVAPEVRIELGDRVRLDGRDVTEQIRTPEVSEAASVAASQPEVRAAMVVEQRRLLGRGDWVAEGRDIGTVVAPGAEVKVFLTASPEARAQRRAAELGVDAATVLAEQAIRDERDTAREHSPLQAAPGRAHDRHHGSHAGRGRGQDRAAGRRPPLTRRRARSAEIRKFRRPGAFREFGRRGSWPRKKRHIHPVLEGTDAHEHTPLPQWLHRRTDRRRRPAQRGAPAPRRPSRS